MPLPNTLKLFVYNCYKEKQRVVTVKAYVALFMCQENFKCLK